MSVAETEQASDWSVSCSDDEKYKIEPADIRRLYERISAGDLKAEPPLVLEWKPPRCRRSPPPTPRAKGSAEEVPPGDAEPIAIVNESVAVPGFDFEDASSELKPVRSARRSTGATPRTNQKRVARLDKIMDDMLRHKKLHEEACKDVRRSPQVKGAPSKSPKGSPRQALQKKAPPKS